MTYEVRLAAARQKDPRAGPSCNTGAIRAAGPKQQQHPQSLKLHGLDTTPEAAEGHKSAFGKHFCIICARVFRVARTPRMQATFTRGGPKTSTQQCLNEPESR